MGKNRKYTTDFKEHAVRMFKENEATKTVTDVANDLGISMQTLYQWVKKAEKRATKAGTAEEAEVARLKRELEQVKMERDFLKKAAAFFAKNQQ